MGINWLDLGIAVVMLLFVVRGLLNGLLREVAGLAGVLLGFFLAGRWYFLVTPKLAKLVPDPNMAALAAYGAVFVGVLLVVVFLASLLRKAMQLTFTAWLDHILGGAVGGVKGGILCVAALFLMHKFVPESDLLKGSLLAPQIETALDFARSLLPSFL